ncbi:uncharacterized protein LY79DRAFT_581098 [Colletotrichum navitas]|uniref:FAD-binding PCMH-type domain-containing protein n=1 Tax=Colletotrichum navitas TaxID=681940 RepID=A0AAD8V433_9PEZI|nr:uncharacterized protein LY79DRAFT_581098 [Colletotrichum navitas]KAK1585490.1 hypothetical protein LY79DRAFT_581098 [Colletotrichum navitas]
MDSQRWHSTRIFWSLLVSSSVCLGALIPVREATGIDTRCKVIPGDDAWPGPDVWEQLNQTVGGRLIATVPQAAVCYPQGFADIKPNQAECAELAKNWEFPQTYINSPAAIANPWYQNDSCSPFSQSSGQCELGNYVSYSISVEGPPDVVAAINFCRSQNVRLVIKNTGHDYLGKSTGKGGLAIWMRNLRSLDIIDSYNSDEYSGPAVKVGAGWTGGEVLLRVAQAGFCVVSGDCPTVGIAGGFSAGGGHGLLNGAYGLGADNVLEWEVVTADGRHLTASPRENADLYWAMTGGGAGTYAVVLSMTARLHPESHVGAATLSFNATSSPSNETYAAAVEAWWRFLPNIVDAGACPAFNFVDGAFSVHNTTAPGKTAEDMTELYRPYLEQIEDLGVPYTFTAYTAPSYIDHYNYTNGPLPFGPYQSSELFNSRAIPRTAVTGETGPKRLTAATTSIVSFDQAANWQLGCMGLNVNATNIPRHADNAVAPFWRDSVAVCLEFSFYDRTVPESTMLARRRDLASHIHPAIEAATSGSGAYLNEADPLVYPQEAVDKWKTAFYGENYNRLYEIKKRWDPDSVFYAFTAVGSDEFIQDAAGRVCSA